MDAHIDIFQAVQDTLNTSRVLYPGCHRHVSASVVFPSVVYIDADSKVGAVFDDAAIDQWVDQHKTYSASTEKEFYCCNYEAIPTKLVGKSNTASFDLLVSLSAGIISTPCTKYVADNGYLLANDSHSDARTAFLNPEWKLVSAWDEDQKGFTSEGLEDYFQLKDGSGPITHAMVEESVRVGTKSKRSFRLKKEGMFFLFQKVCGDEEDKTMPPANKKQRTTA